MFLPHLFMQAISHMSDYVLSNDTVSKVLAMVAESREVKSVLRELLGSIVSSSSERIHLHAVLKSLAAAAAAPLDAAVLGAFSAALVHAAGAPPETPVRGPSCHIKGKQPLPY